MKALVKYDAGPGNVEVRDIPEPSPGKGQVKIKVEMAGICGSDIHIYHSDIAIPVRPPVVMGHEFSGVVTEVGEGVEGIKPGDRVVSETAYDYCGVCERCIEGYYNLCNDRKTLGYWYNGVFTDYTVVPAGRIHLLPDNVDFVSAAMMEPMACVTHALYDLCKIDAGDVVLVSGPGAVGLMAMMVAKAQGAKVIVSGTAADKERLELATELGADYVVNVQESDLKELCDSLTGGFGVDVVAECSGSEAAINSGLNIIKKRGWFCQIGLPGRPVTFEIEKVCYKELHFSGSLGSRKISWRRVLRLLEMGKINLNPLATHTFPITEWEKAFDMFEKKEGCKIMLSPVGGDEK
ncbi:MAG: zinc-dependent alcohol dehydrogenase [Christensenellales bacterium]|jgi:L-iditol 2-dehydrogenase